MEIKLCTVIQLFISNEQSFLHFWRFLAGKWRLYNLVAWLFLVNPALCFQNNLITQDIFSARFGRYLGLHCHTLPPLPLSAFPLGFPLPTQTFFHSLRYKKKEIKKYIFKKKVSYNLRMDGYIQNSWMQDIKNRCAKVQYKFRLWSNLLDDTLLWFSERRTPSDRSVEFSN